VTSGRWRTPVRPRTLPELLDLLRALDPTARLVGPAGARVDGVALHTDQVRPGDLFAGLPGAHRHGADLAGAAARAGAVALLSDRPAPELPTLVVADPRAVLGPLAARLHGDPSHELAVLGVTGTNGKTSTAHLIAAGLAAAGRPAGLAGSLEVRVPGRELPAARTTAEAPAVQEFLAAARDAGARDAVLEVSSHGLALHRVTGTRFRTAVFTNLSPDHLDLHRDLEEYYATKAALFEPHRCGTAVVGVDDEHGRRLAATTRCPVVTFSAAGGAADWTASGVRATAAGTRFRLRGPGAARDVRLRLLGPHQVDNALAAVAALATLGDLDLDAAVRGIEAVPGVPGRLERVDAGQPFLALVDHVHNVGGQRRLLPFLRSLTAGRIVVVLGATGERDRAKRAGLGTVVGRLADVVVVTDESAHGDDPAELRAAVARAARRADGAEVLVEPDRARALALAAGLAAPGDVLLVAGRGADQWQATGSDRRRFDDRVELRAALEARGPAALPRGA
jgi:UDP-N-acetylmuramoyl-L-alanyl-D-glutamate--2,6-diaminopimelate ligase